ncbi:MAG: molybdopterin synthase catalytic subunit MoaE [Gammaproteobacteria bacterium]|nr:molybdopterin synthase catalytic subunit MoaE [Gammaproteobacteria bacterium]
MHDFIRVSESDFNIQDEYQALMQNNSTDGAAVFFVGLVRDFNQGNQIDGLFLEHYPEMTEKSLIKIVSNARARWKLGRVRVIHRVGQLNVSEKIVFVGVSSLYREQSFEAAQFIMDFLKTEAPFWKKEMIKNGKTRWVEADEKNSNARQRWQK